MRTLNINENKINNLLNNLKEYKWWDKLINNENIYVDLRKDNSINVYYHGGSFFEIINSKNNDINFKINKKFLYADIISKDNNNEPIYELTEKGQYVNIKNFSGKIKFELDLDNFENYIDKITENIDAYYGSPEKLIQGNYAVCKKNNDKKETEGIIIDTEFAFNDFRIDLVYLHKSGTLYFVELKTIEDKRLFPKSSSKSNELKEDTNIEFHDEDNKNKGRKEKEYINIQLKKYHDFLKEETNQKLLIQYYNTVLNIKRQHNLINKFGHIKNIKNITVNKICDKPILLIGNADTKFIDNYEKTYLLQNYKNLEQTKQKLPTEKEKKFYSQICEHSYCRIYRGSGSNYLNLGNSKNIYPTPKIYLPPTDFDSLKNYNVIKRRPYG